MLFLHADCIIREAHWERIEEAARSKNLVGGCLTQVLDDKSPVFQWIAFTGNVRAKMTKIFYGDQGIFVRREAFEKLGGFPEVKIGEDILFTKKLRSEGKVAILPFPVTGSTRRYKKQGVLKTFFTNLRITAAMLWGVHPNALNIVYEDVRE